MGQHGNRGFCDFIQKVKLFQRELGGEGGVYKISELFSKGENSCAYLSGIAIPFHLREL